MTMAIDWNAAQQALFALQKASEEEQAAAAELAQKQERHAELTTSVSSARQTLNTILDKK
jgi:hypothetical protein